MLLAPGMGFEYGMETISVSRRQLVSAAAKSHAVSMLHSLSPRCSLPQIVTYENVSCCEQMTCAVGMGGAWAERREDCENERPLG